MKIVFKTSEFHRKYFCVGSDVFTDFELHIGLNCRDHCHRVKMSQKICSSQQKILILRQLSFLSG